MHRRSCPGLLSLGVLVLAAIPLRGQTERPNSKVDFVTAPRRDGDVDPPALPRAAPGFSARVSPLAQPIQAPPPGTIGFSQLARAAGSIFSGTVVSIVAPGASGAQAVPTVGITFHVEYAIRGAVPGQDLTIQQWAGLWSGGQRYRIGERMLVFFYPASKLGLTSCVAGDLGRFALDSVGRVVLSPPQAAAFATDAVLGKGRSRIRLRDLARAVARAGGEE